MRKIFTFASAMLLGSVVGCQHCDSGCSSSGCGGTAATRGERGPCTFGVCDCDIPPMANYGPGVGGLPAREHGPVVAAATEAPRTMPQAKNDAASD
jgi:hypothetical protein